MDDKTLNEITKLLNAMSDEEVREQLVELRKRQETQAAQDKPFTCDKCKLVIPHLNAVFDIAISYQTMPEDPADLDFDPQYEVYLCSECITTVVGLPGWKGGQS